MPMPKTILQMAVACADQDLIKFLLEEEPNTLLHEEHVDILNECILSLKVKQISPDECLQILKLLTEQGAVVKKPLQGTLQIPHVVYQYGDLHLLEYLLMIGYECNEDSQPWYRNLLGEALKNDDPSIFEFLLKSRIVDINRKDCCGRTLLFLAAQNSDYEQLNKLMKWGADPNIPCEDEPPLVQTISRHDDIPSKIFMYLLEVSSTSSILSTLQFARKWGAVNHTKELLQSAVMYHGLDLQNSAVTDLLSQRDWVARIYPDHDTDTKEYLVTCIQETQIFKQIEVGQNLTLYSVINQIMRQNYALLRNENITSFLDALSICRFSDIYGPVFYWHYQKGRLAIAQIDQAALSLSMLLGLEHNSFTIVFTTIFKYLEEMDLQNLVCLLYQKDEQM